jgi:hypothetical protein
VPVLMLVYSRPATCRGPCEAYRPRALPRLLTAARSAAQATGSRCWSSHRPSGPAAADAVGAPAGKGWSFSAWSRQSRTRTVSLTKTLPHSPRLVFESIADIEAYPEFLPWCKGATITDRRELRERSAPQRLVFVPDTAWGLQISQRAGGVLVLVR